MIEMYARTPAGVRPIPISELDAGDAFVYINPVTGCPTYESVYVRVMTGDEHSPFATLNLSRPEGPLIRTSAPAAENILVLPVGLGVYITDMGIRPGDKRKEAGGDNEKVPTDG